MFYIISEEDVARIRRVIKLLYSETHMDGYIMWENAQVLDYVLDQLVKYCEHA